MFFDFLGVAFPTLSSKPQVSKRAFEASLLEQQKRLADQFQRKSVFNTHRAYAGQLPVHDGFEVAFVASVNSSIRRARIGKITLKAAA